MILDKGTGAHAAQAEYLGMGWAWTWVSGEGAIAATLVGTWSNVTEYTSPNSRLEYTSPNGRLES